MSDELSHPPSAGPRRWLRAGCGLLAAAALLPGALAATITVRPVKDTTIYGNSNLANGGGLHLFAGSSGERRALRSLVAFDLGQIPAGATINSVTLTFSITTPLASNANTVGLHRVSADWGEGSVIAPMGEGGGAPAATGDATWNARRHGVTDWARAGGDFTDSASASQRVAGAVGTVSFSGAGLNADVQAWINAPASNFGWILVAQNETGPGVRLSSRQGPTPPSLVIDYSTSGGGGGPAPVAPAFTTQPASQTVAAGASATFTVAVTGTPAPALQWRKDGGAIAGATGTSLTLANVTASDAGNYTVFASNVAGNSTSAAATLTVAPGGNAGGNGGVTARLSNLSVRTTMAAGQTLFVGFSVSGGSRSLLIRGVGPTLGGLGVPGVMADPRIELYNGTALVAENDDWGGGPALASAAAGVGAFPLTAGSRDAALLQPVDGTRTLQLKGAGAGVALVELYDTGAGNSPRLVNVSARNHVGTGDGILIFGFFVDGTGTKNLLLRAVGPRLADLGVDGALADPRVDVFRAGTAAAVASNDNWDPALAPRFQSVGAFALTPGSRDAALVTALTPGSYTVQVSGTGNTTGEALVEIYELP